LVVSGTANILVSARRRRQLVRRHWRLVEFLFQNTENAFVAGRADLKRSGACGFEPLLAETLGEAHNPKTGSESLLRMRPCGHDRFHHVGGRPADLFRPLDEPLRRPLLVSLMRLGHVRRRGQERSRSTTARMTCYAPSLVENLDDVFGESNVNLLLDKSVGYAVENIFHRNVGSRCLHAQFSTVRTNKAAPEAGAARPIRVCRIARVAIPASAERGGFNPSKVRLKEGYTRAEASKRLSFQSLKGSIKGDIRNTIKEGVSKFQSLKGSIKGINETFETDLKFSFNPSKVRLKGECSPENHSRQSQVSIPQRFD
jgi:hypothetical protein